MTTACQSRPQPHSSGIAATTATSGMVTNSATRKRCNAEFGSSSRSGRGVRGWVLTAPSSVPPGAGAWSVRAAGRAAEASPALWTVSGEVVIVLLLVQTDPGTDRSWCRQNEAERLYAYVTVAYPTVG